MAADGIPEPKNACSKTSFVHSNKLPLRSQRIERWINKDRDHSLMGEKDLRSSTSLRTSKRPNRSEIALLQSDRRLHLELVELGKQREKFIKQKDYEQKLFATKQVVVHKDNQPMFETLNYVRKCCKFSRSHEDNAEKITLSDDDNDSIITAYPFQNTNSSDSPIRSALQSRESYRKKRFSPANKSASFNDKLNNNFQSHNQQNTKYSCLSANLSRRSRSINSKTDSKRIGNSVGDIRLNDVYSTDSLYLKPIMDRKKEASTVSSKYPASGTFISKSSAQEFRRCPQRFLSQSNRYLPLVEQQAKKIESKQYSYKQRQARSKSPSFISNFSTTSTSMKENNTRRSKLLSGQSQRQRTTKETNILSKLDLMDTSVYDTEDHKLALAYLRECEYRRLQTLINSDRMDRILQLFPTVQHIDNDREVSKHLNHMSKSKDIFPYLLTTNEQNEQLINTDENLTKLDILVC